MADVVKFYPQNAAENPDNVLEQAVGGYSDVLILGWDKDGNLDARASLGMKSSKDVLWLMEVFKNNLLNGVYADDTEG